MWWDEPDVIETEALPPPQSLVVVVNRDNDREESPARVAERPLIIERDGDRYVRRAANDVAPASRPPEVSNQPAPKPAVIVLRNGEQLELTDYAITTDALYDLRGGGTKKIELSDINVAATRNANAARGVNLLLPDMIP